MTNNNTMMDGPRRVNQVNYTWNPDGTIASFTAHITTPIVRNGMVINSHNDVVDVSEVLDMDTMIDVAAACLSAPLPAPYQEPPVGTTDASPLMVVDPITPTAVQQAERRRARAKEREGRGRKQNDEPSTTTQPEPEPQPQPPEQNP